MTNNVTNVDFSYRRGVCTGAEFDTTRARRVSLNRSQSGNNLKKGRAIENNCGQNAILAWAAPLRASAILK